MSDTDLISRYLDKNHNYRHNQFVFENNSCSKNNSKTAYLNHTQLFGYGQSPDELEFTNDSYAPDWFDFFENNSYRFYLKDGGGGSYTGQWGIGSSTNFAESSGIKIGIVGTFASFYGEWDVENAFLRAILGAEGYTVLTFYNCSPKLLHHLSIGKSFAYVNLLDNNDNGYYNYYPQYEEWGTVSGRYVHLNLLGDPTIRLHQVEPIADLEITQESGENLLTWTYSDEDIAGFNVYRSNTLKKDYQKLNSEILNVSEYIDHAPFDGENYYMVKTVKLQETGSGSYYNSSQGIFEYFFVESDSLYEVTFFVEGENGDIEAKVDSILILSGSNVAQGKNIIFKAIPDENYKVKEWKVNNVVVTNADSTEFIFENIESDLLVTVEFVMEDAINDDTPRKFSLSNYPNPFNPATTINFFLENKTFVEIEIFNLLGQKIISLANQEFESGEHNLLWNGTDSFGKKVSSGLYLYRIKTENNILINKMLLVK